MTKFALPPHGAKRQVYTYRAEGARGFVTREDYVLLGREGQKGVKEGHVRIEGVNGIGMMTVPEAALTATVRIEKPRTTNAKRVKRVRPEDEERTPRREVRRQRYEEQSYFDMD